MQRSFEAGAGFEASIDSKVRTLSYAPAKANENGVFELLNESICSGSSCRKPGPTGYTWVPIYVYAIDAMCHAYLQNGLVS